MIQQLTLDLIPPRPELIPARQLLYDYRRDGSLKPGDAIIVCGDGTTQRLAVADLFPVAEGVKIPIAETKESWSSGGQVYFIDGYAWGVNSKLQTISLGTESAVRAAIDNPKLKCGICEIDNIIATERELIKELEENGRPAITVQSSRKLRAVKARNKRIRLTPGIKHRAKHIKYS